MVKGVNFVSLRDAGDPVEVARRYDEAGADEIAFLDITASSDARDTIVPVIERVAEQVFIPLTVGGGVRKVEDVRKLLNAGADKVSINTAAVDNPALVAEAARRFGSQAIVVAVDAKARRPGQVGGLHARRAQGHRPRRRRVGRADGRGSARGRSSSPAWTATAPGRASTSSSRARWRARCRCRSSRAAASAPSSTSRRAWRSGGADAVLAASIFHYGEFSVGEAKRFMAGRGIEMRL